MLVGAVLLQTGQDMCCRLKKVVRIDDGKKESLPMLFNFLCRKDWQGGSAMNAEAAAA